MTDQTTEEAQTKTRDTNPANEATRRLVRTLIEAENLTMADAARESGVKYGTLTNFMGNTYGGDNDRIAGELKKWMDGRADKARALAVIPEVPGFIKTETAAQIHQLMTFAQTLKKMVLVVGGAGIGKTMAIQAYAKDRPNIWVVTGRPSNGGLYPFLSEIAEVMGLTEKVQTKLSRAICGKVSGTGGMIVVDEAQHLHIPTIEELRTFPDGCGIGLVLVGNETVRSRIEGEGRKAAHAQLFSRVFMSLTQPKARPKDIAEIIDAWGVDDKEAVRLLKGIGGKAGALRGMTAVLQIAAMIAAGDGRAMSADHVRAAWAQLVPDAAI